MAGPARVPNPAAALALAFAAVALVLVAAFWRVLFAGETFVLRDALLVTLPSREVLASGLQAGFLPEWNDRMTFGAPFAANPVHGSLQPILWLVALVAPPAGQDLASLVHLAIAGWGTALLSRRLGADATGAALGGILFSAGGYALSTVTNGMPPMIAWLPWVAWAADRLSTAAPGAPALLAGAPLAAVLALQVTAGEPASLTDALLLAALLGAARSERPLAGLGRAALAGLAAVPLAATAVLPGLALVDWTDRAGGVEAAAASVWSLQPVRLLELAWPGALGQAMPPWLDLSRAVADAGLGSVQAPTWAWSLHLGALALGLAALGARQARRGRWLAAGALAFLLLALGRATPLHPLLRLLVPVERLARYPEKHVVGALLLLAALAGAGLTGALGAPRRTRRWLLAPGAALALGVAALWLGRARLAAALPGAAEASVDVPGALDAALASGAWGALAALAAGLALALPRRPGRLAALAVTAVTALHAIHHAGAVLQSAPRELVALPPAVLAPALPVPGGAPPPRVLVLGGGTSLDEWRSTAAVAEMLHQRVGPNVAARYGLGVVPGADGVIGHAVASFMLQTGQAPARQVAAATGLSWVVADEELAPRLQLPVRAAGHGVALAAVPFARPRAFVSPRHGVAGEVEAIGRLLATEGVVDLVRVDLAPPATPRLDGEAALEPPGPCQARSPRPERVELSCTSRLGGHVVLLDAFAPGWSATLDGRPAPILQADGLFRAVAVTPGEHRLVFEYRTPGLRSGAAIALCAWLALGAAVALARRRAGRLIRADPAA